MLHMSVETKLCFLLKLLTGMMLFLCDVTALPLQTPSLQNASL